MAHFEDDDPPIKTGASTKAFRDGWDRIFGEEEKSDVTENAMREALEKSVRDPEKAATFPVAGDSDAIEIRLTSWLWHCKVCNCYVSDPSGHDYHALIKLDKMPENPEKAPDRCATCGWTLAEKPEDGCVVANCSMRNK